MRIEFGVKQLEVWKCYLFHMGVEKIACDFLDGAISATFRMNFRCFGAIIFRRGCVVFLETRPGKFPPGKIFAVGTNGY